MEQQEINVKSFHKFLRQYEIKAAMKKQDPNKERIVSFFNRRYWIDLEGGAWELDV